MSPAFFGRGIRPRAGFDPFRAVVGQQGREEFSLTNTSPGGVTGSMRALVTT